MDDISSSVLSFIILLLMHGRNTFGIAPQGCWYNSGEAGCNFQRWAPPLLDKDFETGVVYGLTLNSINGSIPAGAFSGLHGPITNQDTYIKLYCITGKTQLIREIFTPNLDWVIDLLIFNCYIETGLPSRLLEDLSSLRYLSIIGSDVFINGVVAHDTLAGLTNLQRISISSPVVSGRLPPGFFDGLENLTEIHLRYAELNSIPPNWFNGLASLKNIFVSDNNLQTLPPGLFDELGSLAYIALYNNPWNCTCELMWLLHWTNITVGGVCSVPSVVEDVKLDDAFGMLDCIPPKTNIPSSSVSNAVEKTTAETSIFAGSTIYRTATSLKKSLVTSTSAPTKFTAMSILAKFIHVNLSGTTPTTTTLARILISSSTRRIPRASWKVPTEEEIGASHFMSRMSSTVSTQTAYAQTVYFSSPSGSVSLSNSNSNANNVNGFSNIGVIGGVGGALIALPVTATVVYRRACRNKGVERTSDAQTHGQEAQSIGGANIS